MDKLVEFDELLCRHIFVPSKLNNFLLRPCAGFACPRTSRAVMFGVANTVIIT